MSHASASDQDQKNLRRVVFSSLVGATIEWYDFFLYGVVAGLVFNKLFFPSFEPTTGTILAFGTFAAGFVARPLGGLIFGHFGDKLGRKKMLILTLQIMGAGTVAIGCIPTYDQIGIWAPILLIICRLAQGIGLGGEWGGAVLMAFESAPPEKRAFYGSLPQIGLSLGLLLASGVVGLLSALLPDEAFMAWGWRVGFILSIVLLGVGSYIRSSVQETKDFAESKANTPEVPFPLMHAFRNYPKMLTACIGARFVEGIAFNVFGVYSLTYLTNNCGISRTLALTAVMVAATVMAAFIPFWGVRADRIGKGKIFGTAALLLGVSSFPVFYILQAFSHNIFIVFLALTVPFGIIYAAAYASMASLFSESFEPSVRYSSISFVYQFSGIFASGITPMIATALVAWNGNNPWYLCGYLLIASLISWQSTRWIAHLKNAGVPA